jgi:uncharacterized protein YgfB (UPF0149 family)
MADPEGEVQQFVFHSTAYDDDDDDDDEEEKEEEDLHWVQALTVLMHLGLTDRPCVPHNLISANESPVP